MTRLRTKGPNYPCQVGAANEEASIYPLFVPFSFSSKFRFGGSGMASSSTSDPFNGEIVAKRPPPKAPFKFLVPLIYAPILPLIRIAFRRNPVLRDRLFTGVLAGGFLHGSYLVSELYDAESK